MTNVIKLKFKRGEEAKGREYTYYTSCPVEIGDIVEIDKGKLGIVTAIDVPEEEILQFKEWAKTIIGKYIPQEEPKIVNSDPKNII